MTPLVKGWCPGALRPMESGDGLIVRLKIAGGIVPLALAARIADWSARFGNGEIDLTSRANLQLRGVAAQGLEQLQLALADAGLLDGDAAGEAVRNVIASPLAGLDPDAVLDIRPLVRDLEVRLRDDVALHDLPAKFGFLIDDGGRLGLDDVGADVRFTAVAGPGFNIWLDGCDRPVGSCRADELVKAGVAIAGEFLANKSSAARRMRDLTTLVPAGEGALQQLLCAGLAALAPPHPPATEWQAPPSPRWGEGRIGVLAYLGIGLPFGHISATGLTDLTACALENGASEFRLTPWRAILIPLPTGAAAKALSGQLAQTDLILEPADPRLRVAACPGAPSCRQGTTATRSDASRLAGMVAAGAFLHVSGCAKGCAHPRPAPVTLVGRDGFYDLIRDGAPSDPPAQVGLTLDEAAGHLRQMVARHSHGETA